MTMMKSRPLTDHVVALHCVEMDHSEAESTPPPPTRPRVEEPMWRVYVDGKLRAVYSIKDDPEDKPQATLEAWLGSC